jgi:cytochrome oxidase Cu insertion factor (SCO1/SenC/PrrC family)
VIPIATVLGALVVGLLIFGTRRSEPMTTTRARAPSAFVIANALPRGLVGRPAPRFALTDARGGSLSSASLQGRPYDYLIGSEARLAPLWRAYSAAPQIPGDPQSSHTAAIWLIDKRGALVALVDAGVAIDVGKLTHDLRVLIHTT